MKEKKKQQIQKILISTIATGAMVAQIPSSVFAEEKQLSNIKTATLDHQEKQVTLKSPQVNEVKDTDTEVSGKADSGATVIVSSGDSLSQRTGKADNNGNFTIEMPPNSGGFPYLLVQASKDNKTSGTTLVSIQETVPEAPKINEVKDTDTQITGKARPGSYVFIRSNSNEEWATLVDASGNFSITIPKQKIGTKLTATAATKPWWGKSSTETVITVKGVVVTDPQVKEVKDTDIKVSGKADPGATVTVSSGYSLSQRTGKADNNGNFTIEMPPNLEGAPYLLVQASKDNKTSRTIIVSIQETAPEAPKVNEVKDTDTQIAGKARPGSYVTIRSSSNSNEYWTTVVDASGNFSITISKQKIGTKLTATAATKPWGGKSSAETVITVIK